MNDDHQAVNTWFASSEGQSCADIATLTPNARKSDEEFLRNRLWKAFVAGLSAGHRIEKDRIVNLFSDLIRK